MLWERVIQKSICLFPREVTDSLVWRGEPINIADHAAGSWYFDEWLKMRTGVLNWYVDSYPLLYGAEDPKFFDVSISLNFTKEKLREIEDRKVNIFIRANAVIRNLIYLLMLRFPVSNIALRIWVRICIGRNIKS